MPSVVPIVSRRRVLVGTAAVALLGVAGTACGSTPPVKDVDALLAQLENAQTDDELASAAATGAPPKLATALTVVATERRAHASALRDEITRVSGKAPPTSVTTTASTPQNQTAQNQTPPTSPTPTGPPPAPPTAADVVAALKRSAAGAALSATQQSGYRAGLLGSVAAACTAAVTVTLADPGPVS